MTTTTNRFGSEPFVYGTTTPAERAEWQRNLDALPSVDSRPGPNGLAQVRQEVNHMKAAACNYATGWYDAVKGSLKPEEREAMFALIWPFAEEVGRSIYLFRTGRLSCRKGHQLAWEEALLSLKFLSDPLG